MMRTLKVTRPAIPSWIGWSERQTLELNSVNVSAIYEELLAAA
jgi:hypothetical protein